MQILMNKIIYLILFYTGICNFSFSQKGNIFGRDFDMETIEYVELFRQKIITNKIAEKFDTLIKINNSYILEFQKLGSDFFYYTTEHGYLKLLCIKKAKIVSCFYGSGLEVTFELDKKNIIKWFQINTLSIEPFRFLLNWDVSSYKIRKCIGCSTPVSAYEKDINLWIRIHQQTIVFIGLETE